MTSPTAKVGANDIKEPLSGPAARKKAFRRKITKYALIGTAVLACLSAFIWWGNQPILGPPQVGICRTFVELELKYPETLRLSSYEIFEKSQRLYYLFIGPFGEWRSGRVDCKFKTDPATGGPLLDSVAIDRMPIPQERIDLYNKTIPIILASKPNLAIPRSIYEVTDLYLLKKD